MQRVTIGSAVIVRALWLARRASCVQVIEEPLIPPMAAKPRVVGMALVDLATARKASADGSMACVVREPFLVKDSEGQAAATEMLARFAPDVLFSAKRGGCHENGIYFNMRGRCADFARTRDAGVAA